MSNPTLLFQLVHKPISSPWKAAHLRASLITVISENGSIIAFAEIGAVVARDRTFPAILEFAKMPKVRVW